MEKNIPESQQETEKFIPRQLSAELIEQWNRHSALLSDVKSKSEAKKVELQAAMNAFADPLEKEVSTSHAALRAAIYAAHPDLDSEKVYGLDTAYVEQGIMLLIKLKTPLGEALERR